MFLHIDERELTEYLMTVGKLMEYLMTGRQRIWKKRQIFLKFRLVSFIMIAGKKRSLNL